MSVHVAAWGSKDNGVVEQGWSSKEKDAAKMASKERDISVVFNKSGEAAVSLLTASTDNFLSSVCIVPFHGSQYQRFCCLVLLHSSTVAVSTS